VVWGLALRFVVRAADNIGNKPKRNQLHPDQDEHHSE